MDQQSSPAIQTLTDTELYKRCQEYGGNARLWLRKFGGLLPEVYRRHLYKKKNFISIYEFAKKLAGMSESTVDRILHLSKKLSDKPTLRSKLENGSTGWSKLETVAHIATSKTDQEWAEKVEKLGTPALQEYVKEYRLQVCQTQQNLSDSTDIGDAEHNPSLWEEVREENMAQEDRHEDGWKVISFPMSPKTELKLRSLKQQFEKENKQAMSWNEVIMEMIKRLEAKGEVREKNHGREKEQETSLRVESSKEKEPTQAAKSSQTQNCVKHPAAEDEAKGIEQRAHEAEAKGIEQSVHVVGAKAIVQRADEAEAKGIAQRADEAEAKAIAQRANESEAKGIDQRAHEDEAKDIERHANESETKAIVQRADEAEIKGEVTRYIPAEVRHLIKMRSGGKCEFPRCNYPPEIYHHTRRFALKKNHDPTFIRALCKKHEGILQAGLVTNEEGDPSTWNIRNAPEWWDMKNIIDAKAAAFRREPQLELGG